MGLGLLVALLLLMVPASGPRGEAFARELPDRGLQSASARAAAVGHGPGPAGSRIQEVAPPAAVLQLSEALAERQPRVRIIEPADGALLPDGPWTLRLQLEDWPLVDAGALGLGPHLLVQIDDAPPFPLLETSLSLPPLSPGSHRLTVMAARPWGEVVKRPGSFHQIRLNRIAANRLGQPAPGTPQLLATAPLGASQAEPVLLDWLLIDAPLQHLRADDARWRLRISVNGDSFLVDQATPLWLRGWRQGSNALLLELVDGQGEPLNPPFNSLVREIRLESGAPRPVWLGDKLAEDELAQLLGLQPAGSPALPARAEAAEGDEVAEPGSGESQESSGPGASDAGEESPVAQARDALEALPEPASAPLMSEPPATGPPQTEEQEPAPLVSETPMPTPSLALGESSAAPDPLPAPAEAARPTALAASPAAPARRVRAAARDEVNPDGTLIRPTGSPLQALRERLKR